MEFDAATISRALNGLVALVLSLSIHEFAHAWVAKLRGDGTAESMGRLTLNPVAHIDPVGTILLPLIGAFSSFPILGWAKPVPVDLRNVKDPRVDNFLISAAGPVSNLLLCAISLLALLIYQVKFVDTLGPESFFFPLITLLESLVFINAILAFLNLIPVPPLDGAAVFSILLPESVARAYNDMIAPFGIFLLFGLVASGALDSLVHIAQGYMSMLGTLYALIFQAIGL